MEINSSFVRDMNYNYLVLEEQRFFSFEEEKEDFRNRMVLENRISHLLPMEKRIKDGRTAFYYEISQMQSLESLYERKEMSQEELIKLLAGCVQMFQSLEEFLLEGEQIILEPAYIYIQEGTGEPYFVYTTFYEKDVKGSFVALTDYLLTKIDHKDEKAVMLGYQVYRYTRGMNFVLQGITELLDKQKLVERKEKALRIETPVSVTEEDNEEAYTEPELEIQDKTQKQDGKNKKTGLLFSLLFACCGALAYVVTGVLKVVPVSEEMQLYLVAECMISLVAAALFGVSLWKEHRKEEIPEEEAYDFFEEETTCLEEETHFLEGTVNGSKKRIELTNFPATIGKMQGEGNLCIKDTTVSRVHAKIEQNNGHVYVSDLHSTNGTRKNGVRLSEDETVELVPGDEVMFGGTCFTFV